MAAAPISSKMWVPSDLLTGCTGEVFKLIGKLIRMAIILSIVAMVFNKVVKPRMGSFEDDSA